MTPSLTLAILLQASLVGAGPPPALYAVEDNFNERGIIDKRALARLSADSDGKLKRETLLSTEQRFFSHFGGHRLALDQFVVTQYGGVIDIRSRKVIHDQENGNLLGIEDGKAVYRLGSIDRPKAYFAFDLNERKLTSLDPPGHWGLPGVKSPDRTMSITQRDYGGGEVWLHRLGKSPRLLGKDFRFTYSLNASPQLGNVDCLWLDDTRILVVKANDRLAILNIRGVVEDSIEVTDAPPGVLVPPHPWRDRHQNIVYTCGGTDFLVNVTKKTVSPMNRYALGHAFEASVEVDENQRRTVYYHGKEIGPWIFRPCEARSAPARLALLYTELSGNAVLMQTDGVAAWDAQTGDWRTIKMSANELIGWSK